MSPHASSRTFAGTGGDRARWAARAGTALVAFWICQAFADDRAVAELRGQLNQIKQLVTDFETRLETIEHPSSTANAEAVPDPAPSSMSQAPGPSAAIPAAAAVSAPAVPATPPRDAWRKVGQGLREAEVDALLGPPTRAFELGGKMVWYYYYPGIGAGSVFFGSDGRAASYQRPPRTGW